jgi:predicted transcriptional regulator
MRRRRTRRPTDLELEILKVLWDEGPSTVRHVRDILGRRREIAYTTVLRMLQIMSEKGLVQRDERQRAHVYRSSDSRRRTLMRLAGDLLDRAFDGSASQLVVHALESKDVDPDELAEICRLLDEIERRER